MLCSVGRDNGGVATDRRRSDAWEWDSKTLREIGVAELLMFGTVYCGMTMQFENAAGIAVGLGLSKIKVSVAFFFIWFSLYVC